MTYQVFKTKMKKVQFSKYNNLELYQERMTKIFLSVQDYLIMIKITKIQNKMIGFKNKSSQDD
jgi:hypothetical protein